MLHLGEPFKAQNVPAQLHRGQSRAWQKKIPSNLKYSNVDKRPTKIDICFVGSRTTKVLFKDRLMKHQGNSDNAHSTLVVSPSALGVIPD